MRLFFYLLCFGLSTYAYGQAVDIDSALQNYRRPPEDSSSRVYGEIIRRPHLPNGEHSIIVPVYTDTGKVNYNLYYDDAAAKDPKLLYADLLMWSFLQKPSGLNGRPDSATVKFLRTKHSLAELLNNVLAGSPSAKATWLEIKFRSLSRTWLNPETLQTLGIGDHVPNSSLEDISTTYELQKKLAAQYQRNKKAEYERWKKETGILEKFENLPEKLNDFVLRNDRKAVRKILEAYLPWPLMEPTEVNMWKTWLEAIERPNPQDTLIAVRGLDYETDKIQRLKDGNSEKLAFFSTVLTKNQGSYTRRLRSLSTNRIKTGQVVGAEGLETRSTQMASQFTNHSIDPVASNFQSFTSDLDTAMDFVGHDKVDKNNKTIPSGGLLVVKMDQRRMIPNFSSAMDFEKEFLAPLIVFPDEVLYFEEGRKKDFTKLSQTIHSKTGIHLDEYLKEIEYLNLGRRFLNETSPKNFRCSHVF